MHLDHLMIISKKAYKTDTGQLAGAIILLSCYDAPTCAADSQCFYATSVVTHANISPGYSG